LTADLLTANALHDWCFGTLSQRLSPLVWNQIFLNSFAVNMFESIPLGPLKFPIFLIASFALVLVIPKRRVEQTLSFLCFLLPILAFTNLFYIHDYYYYENNIFFFVFIGFTMVAIWENCNLKGQTFIPLIVIPLFLSFSYAEYRIYYFPHQTNVTLPQVVADTLGKLIRNNTRENDVLLIYSDTDPTIPYYSQRRALMDKRDLPLDSPLMSKALVNLDGLRIGAMVIQGPRDIGFIRERILRFRLNPQAIKIFDYLIFFKDAEPPNPQPVSGPN
jgi:hypothetical protein